MPKLIFMGTHGKGDAERATLPSIAANVAGACTKPRGITEDQLIKGAQIVGAAMVVEEISKGAQTVSFA